MSAPRWVEDYLQIPYVDGGRDRAGCDCWGLVRLVLRERAGVACESYGEISARQMAAVARNALRVTAAAPWRISETPQPFDVLLMAGRFQTQDGKPHRAPVHVGVMVTTDHVLHTEEDSGPVVAALTDAGVRFRALPPFYRHELLCPT